MYVVIADNGKSLLGSYLSSDEASYWAERPSRNFKDKSYLYSYREPTFCEICGGVVTYNDTCAGTLIAVCQHCNNQREV